MGQYDKIQLKSQHSAIEAPRRGRRRLKSLAFVPTLVTLGNLLCGFAAIHFAMRAMIDFGAGVSPEAVKTLQSIAIERAFPSYLSIGAILVILGMVFDCFDGLIARATRSTTNFGGQLDSLADVVTCGTAPAVLMVAFITTQLAGDSILPSPISQHVLGRATWMAAALYVALAAIRLARFNVEHASADHDYRTFRGLPSPGAACMMVTLILVQEYFDPLGKWLIALVMPGVAVLVALLMVSRIPYRRFYRAYLVGRQPFGHMLIVLLMVYVLVLFPAPTMLVVVGWYILSGPTFWLLKRVRGRYTQAETLSSADAQSDDSALRTTG